MEQVGRIIPEVTLQIVLLAGCKDLDPRPESFPGPRVGDLAERSCCGRADIDATGDENVVEDLVTDFAREGEVAQLGRVCSHGVRSSGAHLGFGVGCEDVGDCVGCRCWLVSSEWLPISSTVPAVGNVTSNSRFKQGLDAQTERCRSG